MRLFHIHCALENASHEINGVQFEDHPEGGVITAKPVDETVAEPFGAIPGYQLLELDPEAIAAAEAAAEAARRVLSTAKIVPSLTPAAAAPSGAPTPVAVASPPAPVATPEAAAPPAATAPAAPQAPPADAKPETGEGGAASGEASQMF